MVPVNEGVIQGVITSLFSEFQSVPSALSGVRSEGAFALMMARPVSRIPLDPSAVGYWHRLMKRADSYPPGSEAWNTIWERAYQFALRHIGSDYHFYLNAAIALSRLGRFKEALFLLIQAEKNGQGDEDFLCAVKKQVAFVLYMKKYYFESLQLYRSVYGGHAQVSASEMKYLKK